MATSNEKLRSASVRHHIDLIQYRDYVLDQLSVLKDLKEDTLLQIQNRVENIKTRGLSVLTLKKYENLLSWIEDETDSLQASFYGELTDHMVDLGQYESSWQTKIFKSSTPSILEFDLEGPSATVIRNIITTTPMGGNLLEDYTSAWSSAVKSGFTKGVRLGLMQGETTGEIVKRVEDVVVSGKRSARTVVQTAISGTSSQIRDRMFKDNEDLLDGVQWVSTLDSRTSEICRGLDGQVFPIDSGPRPPAHFNCRSTTTPIIKSWKDLGFDIEELPPATRPSVRNGLAGDVPSNKTYNDWLKDQDASFQKEILGQAKYELFSKGKLSLDRFIDDGTLKPLSLDEIRKREPEAWKKAFSED